MQKENAANNRPISLTSILCKLFEHIVDSNNRDHLDKYESLIDAQHGFRQKKSCESQLASKALLETITSNDAEQYPLESHLPRLYLLP